MSENPLGRASEYAAHYSPQLLFGISRAENRERLQIDTQALPFYGYDLWRAYEISWLDLKGKPVVATAEFVVPADSAYIIESKSLKLYLNSLNQSRYGTIEDVQRIVATDLSAVAGSPVVVRLYSVSEGEDLALSRPDGILLDALDVSIVDYTPNAELLLADKQHVLTQTLYSNLFKSNCPVTAQPDWGTVVIQYHGPAIEKENLLRYLISFRQHEGFHEDCAEHVFQDLTRICKPQALNIAIHFLRRGGLEINPVRSSAPITPSFPTKRFVRQ